MASGSDDRDGAKRQAVAEQGAGSARSGADDIRVVVGKPLRSGSPRPTASPSEGERLSRIFGDEVPAEEVRIWAGIPPSKRDKALQRVTALDRYCGGEEGLTAKQAAADAGLTLGRFYQIARLWAVERSLAHLGTYASATKPRRRFSPDVVNALQAVVPRIVASDPQASVTELARLLADASGLPPGKVPGKNTLRMFVERELRRERSRKQAGNEVLFDCSAVSLVRKDGALHTVFLVIDDGTDLILGHAVGEATRSVEGYRLAALNALGRIRGDLLPAGIWAPALENSQLVPGLDADAVKCLVAALAEDPGGVVPQLTGALRHGVYMRAHLGQRLGPIQLLPRKTARSDVAPSGSGGEALTVAEAGDRVELAVGAHNDETLARTTLDGEPASPEGLDRLLGAMAGL